MADDAAIIPDVAAAEAESIADEAAIMLDVAAAEAESIADEAASIADEAGAIVAGGVAVVVVVVVDVSSFLLQAAKEIAAASETMSRAVFIFLLDFQVVRTISGNCGNPSARTPSFRRHGMQGHLPCLTAHYRHLKGFP
ncbi:MAG TPA: hypothetical protein VFF72_05855 [Caldimonas sp.]|nr:hypothetical protein [Caldimonas sp.]